MVTEKEISLKVDPELRIGVNDIINLLKGLRSEKAIKIVRTSEHNYLKNKSTIENPTPTKNRSDQSFSVTGNTDLPQIRELNEIAAITFFVSI